jgi:antitoxin (DNA-binding transcriptional repressor) of toxin-antitoxin stability system
MTELPVTQARKQWSDLLNQVAFKGERVLLRRNGKTIAALVPPADVDVLEALEDRIDLEDALRRSSDGKTPVPLDEVKRQLGLD